MRHLTRPTLTCGRSVTAVARCCCITGGATPTSRRWGTIAYYDEVVALLGAGNDEETALAATQEFFRLFMVPGMGHCRGGPGPDRFDALTALEQWVEDEVAPERIIASKLENGEVTRTRPLCPYPQVARWNGVGSTDDAANFTCVIAAPE